MAIKVLDAHRGAPSAVKREVAAAAALRHPHIVQLLDCISEGGAGEGGGCLALVWELVDGCDLLDYLNAHGGRLGEATAAHFLAQLVCCCCRACCLPAPTRLRVDLPP